MKAYLFNTENGLYAGEMYADADTLVQEDGITIIAPPDYGHGHVPVFDRQQKQWIVIPVTTARQLLNLGTATTMEAPQ